MRVLCLSRKGLRKVSGRCDKAILLFGGSFDSIPPCLGWLHFRRATETRITNLSPSRFHWGFWLMELTERKAVQDCTTVT
ncbi:hypothetical protein CEXT_353431 [Caerostris extrusa]|uniref:Uncharacterized protein n=1 Tax=Caerostris extrusa TaxID=172846 RepID=A0AAV4QIP7_CAEEX|nr:hypothetical protein CEXT_353431 [Caerostris extrusa]